MIYPLNLHIVQPGQNDPFCFDCSLLPPFFLSSLFPAFNPPSFLLPSFLSSFLPSFLPSFLRSFLPACLPILKLAVRYILLFHLPPTHDHPARMYPILSRFSYQVNRLLVNLRPSKTENTETAEISPHLWNPILKYSSVVNQWTLCLGPSNLLRSQCNWKPSGRIPVAPPDRKSETWLASFQCHCCPL